MYTYKPSNAHTCKKEKKSRAWKTILDTCPKEPLGTGLCSNSNKLQQLHCHGEADFPYWKLISISLSKLVTS